MKPVEVSVFDGRVIRVEEDRRLRSSVRLTSDSVDSSGIRLSQNLGTHCAGGGGGARRDQDIGVRSGVLGLATAIPVLPGASNLQPGSGNLIHAYSSYIAMFLGILVENANASYA